MLKGLLFEYYITTENTEACDYMNKRSKQYIAKLNQGLSEEGYIIRERLLERISNLEEVA